MSDTLNVTVYADGEALCDNKPTVFTNIDYVSNFNGESFGPPALVAPNPKMGQSRPVATAGQTVLYLNTALIPAYLIERA